MSHGRTGRYESVMVNVFSRCSVDLVQGQGPHERSEGVYRGTTWPVDRNMVHPTTLNRNLKSCHGDPPRDATQNLCAGYLMRIYTDM